MKEFKFGTLKGVFIPNVTMMFGVILFLRLSIIVSHSGIWQQLGVIALSLAFMLITSFSIASIATNMEVGSGGVYYLITRTLGIEVGGAVGFVVYFAQIITTAFTITGFAYLFCDRYPQFSLIQVEIVSLLILSVLAMISTSFALRAQTVISVFIMLAIGSVFLGSADSIPAVKDLRPFYESGRLSFWETFGLFYPAMTGIEAGMALSGNLKNPARSLSLGNISSLIFVAIIYASLSIFMYVKIPLHILKSNPFVLIDFAYSPSLVVLGVYCATLSSALGCLVAAPRILHSLSEDNVAPAFFSKTSGKNKEPIRSMIFTATAALFIMLFTTLDQILPILTMICLITYGMLNFISAIAELINTPSWRPKFRVHWAVPLTGAFLSLFLMFILSPEWSFGAIFLIIAILILLHRRNLEVGFHDLRDSFIFFISRLTLYRLSSPTLHAIVWHPQLLVFVTSPSQSEKMIHLSHQLTRRSGILTFGSVVPEEMWSTPEQLEKSKETLESYFLRKKIGCLVEVYPSESMHAGMINLIKAFGIGPIQPNTIVINMDHENFDYAELIKIIETCRTMRKNLVLFQDSDSVNDKRFIKLSLRNRKRIDLWWDGSSSASFDLTASLVKTLYDVKAWRNSQVHLNVISPHTQAKDPLKEYIQDFVTKSRLKMIPCVHNEPSATDYLPFLEKYSKKADLTCICLRPIEENESTAEYISHLKDVFSHGSKLGVCAYITCYDQVDHSEIYYYPSGVAS